MEGWITGVQSAGRPCATTRKRRSFGVRIPAQGEPLASTSTPVLRLRIRAAAWETEAEAGMVIGLSLPEDCWGSCARDSMDMGRAPG